MTMKEKICKDAEECKKLYRRMFEMAEELEEIRRKLYVNPYHKRNTSVDEFQYADLSLFKLQSDIRGIYHYLDCEEDY